MKATTHENHTEPHPQPPTPSSRCVPPVAPLQLLLPAAVAKRSSLRVMELRSGRRLRLVGAQPPHGSRQRGRGGDDDDGVLDRISGLHDDLLFQILRRLRCAAAAARTSVLSRRWRESSLWKLLPELSFRGVAPGPLEAALAQVVVFPTLSFLEIAVPDHHTFSAEAVASLLRAAARLNPVELSIAIPWEHPIPIEVPSFSRTTSIVLTVNHPHPALPGIWLSGEFPVLERLSITSGRLDLDTAGARCPQLRVLEFINCQGLDTITVHSATVEELHVTDKWLRSVDIVAPVLKRFTLRSRVLAYFCMSLLAPRLENVSWNCLCRWWFCSQSVIGIDALGMWDLDNLTLRTEVGGFVLGLDIGRPPEDDYAIYVRNLQEMFQFPNISILELRLCTRGHVYGAVVLQLLGVCNAVQRLKLVITSDTSDEECPSNCPFDEREDHGSHIISLMHLKEVEITNFKGRGHEVDFLKLLFSCAPLKKVTVLLASCVVASSQGCKEAYNIFMANPDVDCHVYRRWGNRARRLSMRDPISF